MKSSLPEPLSWLQDTDVYLIDQILKQQFDASVRVLDAGSGYGRNLWYFIHRGHDVYANDIAEDDILYIRKKAREINSSLPEDNFRIETIESSSFPDEHFGLIICNAVLHFAKDVGHFNAMIDAMWRMLKKEGTLFCRMASSIGIENRIKPTGQERHFILPDGSKRFLVDETMLLRTTHRLGAKFLEPIKTVNVQNERCMTTWVLGKK
jgi:2-polyprenyl-3-methyl-5-hydroxy-6-metoxy-1,4-benzoquinol methylase